MEHIKTYPKMTMEEFRIMMKELSDIYELVRVVDVSRQKVIGFREDGTEYCEENDHCFHLWGKDRRCENCCSAVAFMEKGHASKFDIQGDNILHVTASYIEIDHNPYVLEILEDESESAVVFGRDAFIEKITKFYEDLYMDSLTGIYNRRYLDKQLLGLEMDVIAMLDIDNFKAVNDTYGHLCGDMALKKVAQTIQQNIRSSDSVIRYGGDELLITFSHMQSENVQDKCQKLREQIAKLKLPDHEALKLTISMGVVVGRGRVMDRIAMADRELYRAKRTKNSISINVLKDDVS